MSYYIKSVTSTVLRLLEDKDVKNPAYGWTTVHRVSVKKLENFDILLDTLIKHNLLSQKRSHCNYLELYTQDSMSPSNVDLVYLGTFIAYSPGLDPKEYAATHTIKFSVSNVYLYPAIHMSQGAAWDVSTNNIPLKKLLEFYPYHTAELYKTFEVATTSENSDVKHLGTFTISKIPHNPMGSITLTSEAEFHSLFIPEEYPVSPGFPGGVLEQDKGILGLVCMGINKKHFKIEGTMTYRINPESLVITNGIDSTDKAEWSTRAARSGLFLLMLDKKDPANIGKFEGVELSNSKLGIMGLFSVTRSTSNLTCFSKVESKMLDRCTITHKSEYNPSYIYTGLGAGVSLVEVKDSDNVAIGCIMAGSTEIYSTSYDSKICSIEYTFEDVEAKHENCSILVCNKYFVVWRYNNNFKESTDLKAKRILKQYVNVVHNSRKHADVCTIKPSTSYTNVGYNRSAYAEEAYKVKKVLKRTENTVILECGV